MDSIYKDPDPAPKKNNPVSYNGRSPDPEGWDPYYWFL